MIEEMFAAYETETMQKQALYQQPHMQMQGGMEKDALPSLGDIATTGRNLLNKITGKKPPPPPSPVRTADSETADMLPLALGGGALAYGGASFLDSGKKSALATIFEKGAFTAPGTAPNKTNDMTGWSTKPKARWQDVLGDTKPSPRRYGAGGLAAAALGGAALMKLMPGGSDKKSNSALGELFKEGSVASIGDSLKSIQESIKARIQANPQLFKKQAFVDLEHLLNA